MNKVYSKEEKDFIKANYPTYGAAWVAEKLEKKASQIKSFAKNNKLTRVNLFYVWDDEKLQKLISDFPNRKTEEIAKEFGFSYPSVSNKAYSLGLKKTDEFMREHGNRLQGTLGIAHRFSKGHVPANKGKKMPPELKERIKHTFFQPGQLPVNTKHFGNPYLYERKRNNGYVERVWWIQEAPGKRSAYLAYLCRQNGIDLTGKKPRLKPGFDHSRPPTMDDIIIVTNAENLEQNSIYRYPEEVVNLIKMRGALTRQINKLKENE
jgi:hypothetical protein